MRDNLVLYQSETCPYCQRVRRFMAQAGIELPIKDVNRDPAARRELIEGGGTAMVPCLRIDQDGDVRWLYESLDIIDYLRRAFEASTTSSSIIGVQP